MDLFEQQLQYLMQSAGVKDTFFGAGGMFFNLTEKRKYNIVNDNDTEVFNLYTILQEKPTELRKALEIMPIDETLFKNWKKKQEADPIRKAVRFLFLSNFGYMGKSETTVPYYFFNYLIMNYL